MGPTNLCSKHLDQEKTHQTANTGRKVSYNIQKIKGVIITQEKNTSDELKA